MKIRTFACGVLGLLLLVGPACSGRSLSGPPALSARPMFSESIEGQWWRRLFRKPTPVTTLSDCEEGTAQTAITNASASVPSTITLPAGTCTWTTPVEIIDKPITFKGSGIDVTNIINDINSELGWNAPLQITTCSANDFVTVSDITFSTKRTNSGGGFINGGCSNSLGYPAKAMRVTRVKMLGDPTDGGSYTGGRFITFAGINGLVDHSLFYSYTSNGGGNVSANMDNAVSTSNTYHEPFTLGSENAVYIEDCYFYFGTAGIGNGATDNYPGARYVVRNNTIYNNNSGHHGFDSQYRGTTTFEYYGNAWIAESGIGGVTAIYARSGTGVVIDNTIVNESGAAPGYVDLMTPQYYGALSDAQAATEELALWYKYRPQEIYYPTAPWGGAYDGTSYLFRDTNFATGNNPLDGNFYGPDSFDPDYSRTVTDMVTTSGSTTITSATANFVSGDLKKSVVAQDFVRGRNVVASFTSGDATVTSATAAFTAADVGRHISTDYRTVISGIARIASVTNSTTIEMDENAIGTSTVAVLLMADPFIVSVTNSTTAVMNVPATASNTGRSLTIGFLRQGYPLMDQPGRGYFAIANTDNWPTKTTGYSEATYQLLMPIYLAANTLNGGNPFVVGPYRISTSGYVKANRDWYDQTPGGVQTNATTPFNGTTGTGYGTLANRPTTCTVGVGYWATDQGSWNTSSSNPYGKQRNGADGLLYTCTTTNNWSLYYTPYTYPHPLNTP